jgi:uncharacterized protein YkwD
MRSTSLIRGSAILLGLALVPAAPAGAAGPRMGRTERAIVRKLDHQRAHFGLRALRSSRSLARAADGHSREMLSRNYFAHSSANGASFATRIHRFTHARMVGETLAMLMGCRHHTAHQVVTMWMHSPPHRAIVLTRGLHRVGIAMRKRHGVCMVTADFAS